MPAEEDRSEPRGQALDGVGPGRLAQGHVEVLTVGLVPGRQRQPEAELGPGRALGVGDGDAGPAQRPLPDAGDVAVAGEAHLAVLGEADAHPGGRAARRLPLGGRHGRGGRRHARAPASGRGRSATGTAPGRWPVERSWPVPWLPPAGEVAEATTCSMP